MNDVAPVYREEFHAMDPKKIKVHEELRIRQTTPFLEQQIEAMMISFQTSGQLNRIIIDEDDYLIAGYIRLIAARRLNLTVKVVKKYGLSDYQKYLIEMGENITRNDFTSYELTIGFAQLKRKYEIEHPETKWGRNQHESGVARGAVPKNDLSLSFAKKHSKQFNLSERALRDRIRVGDAILEGVFDEKTINQFKEDKITYTEIREKIKAIERLKKEKKELLSKKQKVNQSSAEQKKDKLEEGEKKENENTCEPKKIKSLPNTNFSEGVSKSEEKEEETLFIPHSTPNFDQIAELPQKKHTITKFNDKMKIIVEEPATCKDCPHGKAFACGQCKCSMVRCIPECEKGNLGIYMGDHPACGRFNE